MSTHSEDRSRSRAGKTLIKAFAFAGAILGIGAYGLVRTIVLFGAELDWFSHEPGLGKAYWWLFAGAVIGLVVGWGVVNLGRRKQ